jgi:hypothetical protein
MRALISCWCQQADTYCLPSHCIRGTSNAAFDSESCHRNLN